MPAPRPERLVVMAGTATGVGKTWTTAALVRLLRAGGGTVAARKPVQSFAPDDPDDPVDPTHPIDRTTDADVLARACGVEPAEVCPPHRWYPRALAPPMAEAALGPPPILLADLLGETTWPPGCRVGLVETVGGPRSPVGDDADTAALCAALDPDDVVLVADAGLGAVNAVALAAPTLHGGRPLVLLNRYDPVDTTHVANADWLRTHTTLRITTDIAALAHALALSSK